MERGAAAEQTETEMKQRAKRHLGTYYYVGTLLGNDTCGHKHTTVRVAQACRKVWGHGRKNVRTFMAHLGLLPGRILD